jgi:hypothetical protein
VEDLTAGIEDFPLELSEARLDDRRGDGVRRRIYSQRDVVDLTTGIGGLGLNETPGRQPANHGQRDRPDRRERESEKRGRADSVSNRQVLSWRFRLILGFRTPDSTMMTGEINKG